VETLILRGDLSCGDCVAISLAARPAGGGEIAAVKGCRGALGGRAGDLFHSAFDTSKATPIIPKVNHQTSQERKPRDHN